MKYPLLLLSLLCVSVAQAAEVYKWTDANGIVHYSDAVPPHDATKVERVKVAGGVTVNTEQAAPPAEDKPVAKDEPKPPPGPTTMEDTPENRARMCERSRANLEMLQSKFQISTQDGEGKAQLLDDKTRQARVTLEQQNIATFCK